MRCGRLSRRLGRASSDCPLREIENPLEILSIQYVTARRLSRHDESLPPHHPLVSLPDETSPPLRGGFSDRSGDVSPIDDHSGPISVPAMIDDESVRMSHETN